MAQFAEQCAQPSLPVPMLSHTVDLLLQTLRPLASPDEIESVKQSVAEYVWGVVAYDKELTADE